MNDGRRIEAAIFDLDGVLVDSEPAHHAATQRLIAPNVVTEEEYALFVGVSVEWYANWLIERFELDEPAEALISRYDALVTEQLYSHPLPALEGALELLETIRRQGLPLAVASQSRPGWVQATLEGADLQRHFDRIVTSEAVTQAKPAPDIYLHTAELLGVRATACLALEDSVPGVQAARAAEMFVVQTQQASSAVERQPGADEVITSLSGFRLEWLG